MTERQLDAQEANILPVIQRWAISKADEIVEHYNTKGGWEGWAQAEIAKCLDDHYEEQLLHHHRIQDFIDKVDREEGVYQKNPGDKREKRTDFRVDRYRRDTRERLGATVIELKCESKFNADKFSAGVEKDIVKATTYGLKLDVLPARLHIMAISVSTYGFEEMSKIFQHMPLMVARYRECGMPVRLWMQQFDYSADGRTIDGRRLPVFTGTDGITATVYQRNAELKSERLREFRARGTGQDLAEFTKFREDLECEMMGEFEF